MTPSLQSTPPIGMGTASLQAEQVDQSGGSALDLAEGTPSSNTGCSSHRSGAIVDFLSFTVHKGSVLSPDLAVKDQLPADINDCQFAQRIINACLPRHSLDASVFREAGKNGYTHSATLTAPDVEGQVGIVCIGGNADTIHVSISGAGIPFAGEMWRVACCLQAVNATITRVDLAFDDLKAEFIDIGFLIKLAREGYFDADNGQRVTRKLIDDLGSMHGRSLYLGKKGQRELCIYEKGKQMQSPTSSWVRAEVRLWSKNRIIPHDVLVRPGDYLRGEYPALRPFLPAWTATRSALLRATSEATGAAALKWLVDSAGKTLNFFRLAADACDVHPWEVIGMVSRDGIPKRFAGLSQSVAQQRVETLFKGIPA